MWKRLRKNKLAMVGLGIIIFLVLVAIFADVIAPCDPYEMNPMEKLQFSSAKHLLGTDNYGRDLLSRLIYGSRTSLLVSIISLFCPQRWAPSLAVSPVILAAGGTPF